MLHHKNYEIKPEQLIDTYRRFGRLGPAYHVIAISRKLEGGDALMKIHILESNEDTEYPFSKIIMDPEEDN